MTGKDLGYKPGVVEKVKFEYSPLGEALNSKVKNKTDRIVKIDKQDRGLLYNSRHSLAEFTNVDDFKEMSLDSMYKRLQIFYTKFTGPKKVSPQTKHNKDLKEKVLDKAGDLLNELYYIYKERYNEEKNGLNTKDTKKFDYTKLRLTDDCKYESEEEEQTSKKPDKKEPPKKLTSIEVKRFNKLITKEETGMNRELF